MHDTLLGDIRGLLCLLLAKTNILEYVREQDFCVYVKLSALTRSQQTYKKRLDCACCCASRLCITAQHSFVPDANCQSHIHIVKLCMFSISLVIMSVHTVHLRTERWKYIALFVIPEFS